jgi:hypothetical protein
MKIYLTGYKVKKEFVEAEKAGKPMPERDNFDIVMCADTQETLGPAKRNVPKLEFWHGPTWSAERNEMINSVRSGIDPLVVLT